MLVYFRAEACAERLAELNPYVEISTLTEPLTMASDLAYLQHFQVMMLLMFDTVFGCLCNYADLWNFVGQILLFTLLMFVDFEGQKISL